MNAVRTGIATGQPVSVAAMAKSNVQQKQRIQIECNRRKWVATYLLDLHCTEVYVDCRVHIT